MSKFKIGDLVKITNPETGFVEDHKGEVARCVDVIGDDGGHIELLSDGQKMCAFNHEVESYIPQSGDEITLDGAKYILKDRKAEVGENIIVVESFFLDNRICEIGEIHTCTKREKVSWNDIQTNKIAIMNDHRYLVLENVESKKAPNFQVGDLARVIEGLEPLFDEGDIVKFIEDDGSDCPRFERISDGLDSYFLYERLEPYTPTESDNITVDHTAYVLRNRRAGIGEKVIVIGNESCHGNSINDIVTINKLGKFHEFVTNEGIGNWMSHEKGEYLVLEHVENNYNSQSDDKSEPHEELLSKLANAAVRLSKLEEKSTNGFQPLTNEILSADLPPDYRLKLALEYERKVADLKNILATGNDEEAPF